MSFQDRKKQEKKLELKVKNKQKGERRKEEYFNTQAQININTHNSFTISRALDFWKRLLSSQCNHENLKGGGLDVVD